MDNHRSSDKTKQLRSGQETLPVQLHANPFVAVEELTGTHQPVFLGPRSRPFGRRLNFESPRLDRYKEKNRLHELPIAEEAKPSPTSPQAPSPQAPSTQSISEAERDQECHFQLSDYDTTLIRRKAWQLVGRYGFSHSDLPDIQQELTYRLLKAAKSFDPDRAHRNAFSKTIIERSVATLVRAQRAEKRDYRCHRTFADLSTSQKSSEALDLQQSLSQRSVHHGSDSSSETDDREIIREISDWIESLPEDLQIIARMLQHQTLNEIQQKTQQSRHHLKKKMARLKRSLIKAGFASI